MSTILNASSPARHPHPAQRRPIALRYGAHPFQTAVSEAVAPVTSRAIEGMVPLFQKISEELLYNFLAMDIGGLWLFRISNSLTRGRTPYDATQDPEFKPGMSESQQMGKVWNGFWKGVNLPYFLEEAFREFLIGPGWLTLAASTHGVMRAGLGNGMRMPMGTVTEFSHTLMDHLHNNPLPGEEKGHPVKPGDYGKALENFLEEMVADGPLKSAFKKPDSPFQAYKQAWSQSVLADLAWREQTPRPRRVLDSITDWMNKVRTGGHHTPPALSAAEHPPGTLKHFQATLQQLEKAESQLITYLKDFNRNHLPMKDGHLDYRSVDQIPLKLQQRVASGLQTKADSMAVGSWTRQLGLFRDVAVRAFERKAANPAVAIARHTEQVLGRVSQQKWLASLLAIAALFEYTVVLTEYLQSHRRYPGNRNRTIQEITQGNTASVPPAPAFPASVGTVVPALTQGGVA